MPTRRDFLIASSALATGAFTAAQAATGPKERPLGEIQDELRRLIPDIMRQHNVPGLSLALVREREIVWAEAFGLRDKEANAPLTPETVFEAASLSKPAYAYAVLKLVEQGKFELKRPLSHYLGRDLNPDEPRFRQVTTWHVLTHTSGIEPAPGEGRPPKLEFSPGERFHYSPHAFDILQLAVERAAGETIAPMMERMLLKPFGMTQSAFGWSDEHARSGARGYDAKGMHDQTFNEKIWRLSAEQRAKVLAPYPLESVPNAAAGLHCTASDFARFLVETMRPGKDDFHMGPEMLAQMLMPQVRVGGFDSLSWGLGFGLQHPPKAPVSFWHWGDWGIFQHYAVACRDEGSALVVMTNTNGLLACRDVAVRALGREQPAFDWLTSS
ncbi:MAG TPA: serine hydrolase domain-containing protein [Steroidobacteraceae bacterium]|nr:serine hydrolase domain-containing protein [Steroidobacteraceae bacterium]